MAAKKASANSRKRQETFLEQTIANIEERAKKEIDDIRERIEGGLEEASSLANQRSSKLEEAFDKRVAQAYNRMGLPSKADIVLLEAKLDALQQTVDELIAGGAKPSGAKKASSAKKKTAATAKKTSTRKAAPRKKKS